jgi:MSHA biogenesis protein MshQ
MAIFEKLTFDRVALVKRNNLPDLTVRLEFVEDGTIKPFMVRQVHHERLNPRLFRFKLVVSITRRWVLSLIMLLTLLLAGMPVQATDYVLADVSSPDRKLPPGCSGPDTSNQYTCGELGLSFGDTIRLTTKPAILRFSGILTTGINSTINAGGSAADLTLSLGGAINVGANSHIFANVIDTAAVNIGIGGEISGTITTSTSTGAITTNDNSTVGGAITSTDGAISIGDNSTVKGFITANLGAVTVGNGSNVFGDISADNGAINIGIKTAVSGSIIAPIGAVTIGELGTLSGNIIGGKGAVNTGLGVILGNTASPGNITTTEGIVTIGANNVLGNITTGAGGVNIGQYTRLAAIITGAGGINIGNYSILNSITSTVGITTIGLHATINGDITSGVGAVNIESDSRVCGSLIVNGAGIVTLTTKVRIGGRISTGVGAITINDNSTVGGSVTATSGTVTMTSVLIGGDAFNKGTMTLTDSMVGGSVSTHATLNNTPTNQSATLIIPSACSDTPIIPIIGSTATGFFDCVEMGSSSPALYTKLAGADFTFDIAALKSDKTLEGSYVLPGDEPKYTRVELFNDPDPNIPNTPEVCDTYGTTYGQPVATQIVTFSAGSKGRAVTGAFNLPEAYKKLRCRVTECLDSTCATVAATAIPSCSSDEFAVRPVAVTLSALEANAVAPSEKSMPIVKAGANFTLSAVTTITDKYLGALTLDTGKLTAQNPAQATMSEIGGVVGTLTPTLTANTTPSLATYSEVGYLYLAAGAYRDDDFTQVDSINGKGDCIAGSLSDNLSGGQYGCSIGNAVAVTLGRFTPDHFDITGTVVTRSDLQTVELQSTPFTYMNEPMQLGLTVTAYNQREEVTKNYRGAFASLNTSNWNLANWTCTNLNQTQCMGLSASNGTMLLTDRLAIDDTASLHSVAPKNTSWNNGSSDFTANITLKRSASPDGPYDALKLGAKPQDSDGVTLPPNAATDTTHCVNLNTATGGEASNCKFASADETVLRRLLFTTSVRFGRLNLANASGSELLDLPVPVEVQYWNGSSFAVNALDNLTALADTSIVPGNYQGATPPMFRAADPKTGSCSADSTHTGVVSAGKSCILFGKPSASGSFDMLVNLGSAGLVDIHCLSSTLLSSGSSTPATLGYLSGNWCGTAYDRDPTAYITFGVYNGNTKGINHLIYFRERY